MCDPASATLALSIGSAVSGLYGQQQQQMKAQEEYNQRQYENSMTAYRHNLANIEVERQQAAQDASEQILQNNKAGREAVSTARTSAGEAGVTGTSVDALLADLAGRAAYDNTNAETNYLRKNISLNAQRENVYNRTSSEINSLTTPIGPDYIGAALKIGQGAVNYQDTRQKQKDISEGRRR